MFKVIIASFIVWGCSIEEETSTGLSSWATENSQIGDAPISFERADVNADGVVNIEDLTAVSYWFGATEDDRPIERGIRSDLLTNSTIEVGRPFELTVSADLTMGTAWPMDLAPDFLRSGIHNETCKITIELQAIDNEGQVIDDAIIGKIHPMLDEIAYQPNVYVNNNASWRAWVTGYFTDSSLENGVAKLVVKSGSVCQDRTIQPRKVQEIAVNIAGRSDGMEVQAKLLDRGTLILYFSQPSANPFRSVMVVGEDRLQRGFYGTGAGVCYRARQVGDRHLRSGCSRVSIGTTYQNQELSDYQIPHFKHFSELGENTPEVCAAGNRVFILLAEETRIDSYGRTITIEDSERIYETDCTYAGY